MTASERLRALAESEFTIYEPLGENPRIYASGERIVGLINALPLIADVVEAAESVRRNEAFAWTTLDYALTALREHLEGGDPLGLNQADADFRAGKARPAADVFRDLGLEGGDE